MKRPTLLERVGAVATTGVLAGCLDEGSVGNGDGPGASRDDGDDQDGADGNGGANDTDGNGSDNETGDNGDGNETDGANDSDGTDEGSTDGSDEDAADGSNDTGGSDGANESGGETTGSEEDEKDGAENASTADDGGAASVSRERSSIETTNADCLEGDDHHRTVVEVGEDAVTVAGHLEAPNPCHEAVLEDVSAQDGSVVIEVGLESEGDFCTECVGRIEYEVTVALEGGTPDDVVVYHRGSDGRTEVETDGRN